MSSWPTEEKFPAALAQSMGWQKVHESSTNCYESPCGIIAYENEVYTTSGFIGFIGFNSFRPLTDLSHSALAVRRCADLNLTLVYVSFLYQICREDFVKAHAMEPVSKECLLVLATASQQSRAAFLTLSQQQP
jgi:hypothetical protein